MAPTPQKKKSKKQTSTKKKNKTQVKRKPAFGGNVSWGSKQKKVEEVDVMPLQQKLIVAAILFFLFMVALYVFVDDTPQPGQKQPQARAARNTSVPRKEFSFEHAVVLNSTTLIEAINTQSEDRLIVVNFDDSQQTKEADGKMTRLRTFRRMETLARGLSKKKFFKRYEPEELPLIGLFDCGSTSDSNAEDLCTRILGQKRQGNSVIIYSNKRARPLPAEYRSDRQIAQYLFGLMQPPVKYLEERSDAEEFVAKDSTLNVVYFGRDSQVYTNVADSLRDFARFGRAQTKNVLEAFEIDEDEAPAMSIWRTFGTNPLRFPPTGANISDPQQLTAFVLNNFLPLCGEFNARTQPKYMKRQLPVAFVIVDRSMESEAFRKLVDDVEGIARNYLGAVSFATLDASEYPQLAENIGLNLGSKKKKSEGDDDEDDDKDDSDGDSEGDDEDAKDVLPQIAIHVQQYQKHGPIDLENVRQGVFDVVDPYVEQLRRQQAAQRGGAGEQQGDVDESSLGEVEDDDDDDEEVVEPQDPDATPGVSAPKVEV